MSVTGAKAEVTYTGQHGKVQLNTRWLNLGAWGKIMLILAQNKFSEGVKMSYCFYYTVLMLKH